MNVVEKFITGTLYNKFANYQAIKLSCSQTNSNFEKLAWLSSEWKKCNCKKIKITDISDGDTFMTPVNKDSLHVVCFLIIISLTVEYSIIFEKVPNESFLPSFTTYHPILHLYFEIMSYHFSSRLYGLPISMPNMMFLNAKDVPIIIF